MARMCYTDGIKQRAGATLPSPPARHQEETLMPDQPTQQEIVFEINGQKYDAPVDPMPVKRSTLADGHLTVDHPSMSYAIYLDLRPDSDRQGEYVAHEIIEDTPVVKPIPDDPVAARIAARKAFENGRCQRWVGGRQCANPKDEGRDVCSMHYRGGSNV